MAKSHTVLTSLLFKINSTHTQVRSLAHTQREGEVRIMVGKTGRGERR